MISVLIIVIRYEEHDKDGGSMIKVYTITMVQPTWNSPIDINVIKQRLEEQNSLFPIWKMISVLIIVIQYEEHDQDGGSMIKVYY